MWFVIRLEYNSNKSHNGFTKLKALTTQRLANLTQITVGQGHFLITCPSNEKV